MGELKAGDRCRWSLELLKAIQQQPNYPYTIVVEVVDVVAESDGTKTVVVKHLEDGH